MTNTVSRDGEHFEQSHYLVLHRYKTFFPHPTLVFQHVDIPYIFNSPAFAREQEIGVWPYTPKGWTPHKTNQVEHGSLLASWAFWLFAFLNLSRKRTPTVRGPGAGVDGTSSRYGSSMLS